MDTVNFLLEREGGEEGVARWMLGEHTVKEVQATKRAVVNSEGKPTYDPKVTVPGKADDTTFGASILGPKGGPFFLGLNGLDVDGEVVVDMWMTRWYRRQTGRVTEGGKMVDVPSAAERKVIGRMVKEVAERRGISARDAQAVIWFYEQRLYNQLGSDVTATGYSDGARRYATQRERSVRDIDATEVRQVEGS